MFTFFDWKGFTQWSVYGKVWYIWCFYSWPSLYPFCFLHYDPPLPVVVTLWSSQSVNYLSYILTRTHTHTCKYTNYRCVCVCMHVYLLHYTRVYVIKAFEVKLPDCYILWLSNLLNLVNNTFWNAPEEWTIGISWLGKC